MEQEYPFTNSEWHEEQKMYVSSRALEGYGADVLLQLFENLFESRTIKEFHELISELVFHARHLLPYQHAILSKMLKQPFAPGHRRSRLPDRDAAMRNAVRKPGGMNPPHPWQGLKRKDLISAMRAEWRGMSEDAASKAIAKAKAEVKSGMR